MNNAKRTETFVFEFENQEIFKGFFEKYYPLTKDKLIPGMKCLGVATGNKLKEEENLLDLIGQLYDIGANNISSARKDEILEKAEKLLGIY